MKRIEVPGGAAECLASERDWSRWRVTLPDSGGAPHTEQLVVWLPPAATGLGMVPVTVCDDRPDPLPIRETWLMPPVGDARQFAARVGWPGNRRAEATMGQALYAIFRCLGFHVDDPAVAVLWAEVQEARRQFELAAPVQRAEADMRYARAFSAYDRAVKVAGATQLAERREEPA